MAESDSATANPGVRIWVLGVAGAGKSTFAAEFGALSGVPHVELDEIFWLPDWKKRTPEEFVSVLEPIYAGKHWISDGQYQDAIDRYLERSTVIVWLDPPRRRSLRRLVRRTLVRLVRHEMFCGENYESVSSVFGRKSILYYACLHYREERAKFATLFRALTAENRIGVRYASPDTRGCARDLVERLTPFLNSS